jgi:hypothetical protein
MLAARHTTLRSQKGAGRRGKDKAINRRLELGRLLGRQLVGIGILEDAIDAENRTPHCLNRALAIDFRITHFEVIFLKGDEAREEREGAGVVKGASQLSFSATVASAAAGQGTS